MIQLVIEESWVWFIISIRIKCVSSTSNVVSFEVKRATEKR